jgi:hemerythrin superfamily protein
MDELSRIEEEHQKVRELATQLEAATAAGDAGAAKELTQEITAELNSLAAVEEEVLYPAAVDLAPELRPQVEQALDGHLMAKELLYAARVSEPLVGDAPPDTELVRQAVEHHLADEGLIRNVRAAADERQLGELAQALEDKAAAVEEASAAGREIKQQEEADRAGEADRKEAVDLSSTAARVRNQ